MTNKKIELYIHIPFCVKKFNYCDFLSFQTDQNCMRQYTDALCNEIKETAVFMKNCEIVSVFFGGGTPSLLPVDEMQKIMKCITKHFCFIKEEKPEISMEMNPGTVTKEHLKEYKKMGFNRISIGLQSTNDKELSYLGRIHTYDQFLQCYEWARQAGFQNINIDVMSALPSQTLESYEETLFKIVNLKPEHISSYSLILEEGTPFYESEELRALLPSEETERTMYERTKEILKQYGYERYEISNYAKPGYACKHNLGYWSGTSYIGMGLGASSYLEETMRFPLKKQEPYPNKIRCKNTSDFNNYLKKPFTAFSDRGEYEVIGKEEQQEEYMILGLRKMSGISRRDFEQTFGISVHDVYGNIIETYKKTGHIIENGDRIYFSDRGIDVSNTILCEFIH